MKKKYGPSPWSLFFGGVMVGGVLIWFFSAVFYIEPFIVKEWNNGFKTADDLAEINVFEVFNETCKSRGFDYAGKCEDCTITDYPMCCKGNQCCGYYSAIEYGPGNMPYGSGWGLI